MLFLKFDSWQQQQQCLECDFHFSVQYRTPLSQFEDKSVHYCSLYCCLAVWLCKAHEDRLDQNIKKKKKKKKKNKTKYKKKTKKKQKKTNKTKLCGVPRHLPHVHKENQHPMRKEESH